MHSVAPLINGILGAESGTVDFYRRGTSTRVTYYTSFEGDGATTPTGSVDLDTYGGGVFYVNETVTVVVKDSTGTELRRFVSAYAAAGVEVISQSFTGTDYDSGASATSEPLPLSSVLDLWYTNAGAPDFKVLVGGVATTIRAALGAVGVLFFSVKDPTYGAVGDGTTADISAVQACVNAASAAGGGIVFFPKGTYNLGFSPALLVPAKVSLLGAGPGVSILRKSIDAGANELVNFVAATNYQSVRDLSFASAVPSTRAGIGSVAACKIVVENCTFGDATNTMFGIGASTDTSGLLVVRDSSFFPGDAGGAVLAAGRATVDNCEVTLPATYNGTVYIGAPGATSGLRLLHCRFISSAMAAGTGTLFSFSGASTHVNSVVMGCLCDNPGGGTLNISVGPGIDSQGCNTYLEIGNDWGSALVRSSLYGDQATATTHPGSFVMERERSRYYTADDTGAVAIPTMLHALAEVVRTTTGIQTVTLAGPGPVNQSFTLVYHNDHGAGGGTITMAGNVKGLTTFTVNANCVSYYLFKSVHRGTSKHWVMVGSSVNQAE